MKFTENSLVVDVVKISNSSYKLSVPAGDLMTAAMNGAVLRRHDLSTAAVPNVLYVPLSEAKLSSGTYSFTFASGDKFTASAADAYPAASSVSDKTDSELPAVGADDKNKYLHTNESTGALEWAEGGSGGGVLVVTETVSGDDSTLSATYKQIADAGFCVRDVDAEAGGGPLHTLSPLAAYGYAEGFGYVVRFLGNNNEKLYIAETENDYPVYHAVK